MQQKTFYKILFEFGSNPNIANKSLANKRLTATDMPFVEAQRKFIMGLALNNLSSFGEAENMIKEGCNYPLMAPAGRRGQS